MAVHKVAAGWAGGLSPTAQLPQFGHELAVGLHVASGQGGVHAAFDVFHARAAQHALQVVTVAGDAFEREQGLHFVHGGRFQRVAAQGLAQGGPGLGAVFVKLPVEPGKKRAVGGGLAAKQVLVWLAQGGPGGGVGEHDLQGAAGAAGRGGAKAGGAVWPAFVMPAVMAAVMPALIRPACAAAPGALAWPRRWGAAGVCA